MLLDQAGIPFRVVASDGDEEQVSSDNPMLLALERALVKAHGARLGDIEGGMQPGDAILAADTVVAVGDQIFGKPRDDDDARRMLRALSGTRHKVITGQVCWVPPGQGLEEREARFVAFAHVTMRELDEDDIEAYLGTGEHAERSGGYAIQESADRFVIDREGEHDTVVGLNIIGVHRIYLEATDRRLPGADVALKGGEG